MVPFLSFEYQNKLIREQVIKSMTDTFDSNWYIIGERLGKFEKDYAKFNATNFCIGVGNGLDALILALKSLGIKEGDEVIVPSNTYIATWLAVSSVGATPRPVEPDIKTYNLDSSKLTFALNKNVKAIMPVHLYGQSCKMDSIMEFAKIQGSLIKI
jgi:dTDP-4-amino-4,6-dideoxygalactose transaminase